MRLLAMLPQAGQLTPNAAEQCKVAAFSRSWRSTKTLAAGEGDRLSQANLVDDYGAALLVPAPCSAPISGRAPGGSRGTIAHEYFFAE